MQVFKAYFKLMRGAAATLSINLFVFLALAVLFSFIAPEVQPAGFEPSRIPVAIINRDKEGEVSQGLAKYMELSLIHI